MGRGKEEEKTTREEGERTRPTMDPWRSLIWRSSQSTYCCPQYERSKKKHFVFVGESWKRHGYTALFHAGGGTMSSHSNVFKLLVLCECKMKPLGGALEWIEASRVANHIWKPTFLDTPHELTVFFVHSHDCWLFLIDCIKTPYKDTWNYREKNKPLKQTPLIKKKNANLG